MSYAQVPPPRVVVYLHSQTNLDLLPSCFPHLTAINLATFHIGFDQHGEPYLHLNGRDPHDGAYTRTLWPILHQARQAGVKVIATLGGDAGAYKALFEYYEMFYPSWCELLRTYAFDGVDLMITEKTTQADLTMLVGDLRRDFPRNFCITAAPVASALSNGYDPFSGIEWKPLAANLDWFNVQFYNGWGSLATAANYRAVISAGYHPSQIVAGAMALPVDNKPASYVPIQQLVQTLSTLARHYPGQFGGTSGWEWFNARNPAENIDPAGWCAAMKAAVQGAPTTPLNAGILAS